MTFAEIEKLLEKGFTPEQITKMSETSTPGTVAPGTVAPGTVQDTQTGDQTQTQDTQTGAQTQDTTPTWATTLNESIQSLKRTMQAAALAGSSQAAPVSTEDAASAALASIISPTFKKEEK